MPGVFAEGSCDNREIVGWVSAKRVTHRFCFRGGRSGGFANPPYELRRVTRPRDFITPSINDAAASPAVSM